MNTKLQQPTQHEKQNYVSLDLSKYGNIFSVNQASNNINNNSSNHQNKQSAGYFSQNVMSQSNNSHIRSYSPQNKFKTQVNGRQQSKSPIRNQSPVLSSNQLNAPKRNSANNKSSYNIDMHGSKQTILNNSVNTNNSQNFNSINNNINGEKNNDQNKTGHFIYKNYNKQQQQEQQQFQQDSVISTRQKKSSYSVYDTNGLVSQNISQNANNKFVRSPEIKKQHSYHISLNSMNSSKQQTENNLKNSHLNVRYKYPNGTNNNNQNQSGLSNSQNKTLNLQANSPQNNNFVSPRSKICLTLANITQSPTTKKKNEENNNNGKNKQKLDLQGQVQKQSQYSYSHRVNNTNNNISQNSTKFLSGQQPQYQNYYTTNDQSSNYLSSQDSQKYSYQKSSDQKSQFNPSHFQNSSSGKKQQQQLQENQQKQQPTTTYNDNFITIKSNNKNTIEDIKATASGFFTDEEFNTSYMQPITQKIPVFATVNISLMSIQGKNIQENNNMLKTPKTNYTLTTTAATNNNGASISNIQSSLGKDNLQQQLQQKESPPSDKNTTVNNSSASPKPNSNNSNNLNAYTPTITNNNNKQGPISQQHLLENESIHTVNSSKIESVQSLQYNIFQNQKILKQQQQQLKQQNKSNVQQQQPIKNHSGVQQNQSGKYKQLQSQQPIGKFNLSLHNNKQKIGFFKQNSGSYSDRINNNHLNSSIAKIIEHKNTRKKQKSAQISQQYPQNKKQDNNNISLLQQQLSSQGSKTKININKINNNNSNGNQNQQINYKNNQQQPQSYIQQQQKPPLYQNHNNPQPQNLKQQQQSNNNNNNYPIPRQVNKIKEEEIRPKIKSALKNSNMHQSQKSNNNNPDSQKKINFYENPNNQNLSKQKLQSDILTDESYIDEIRQSIELNIEQQRTSQLLEQLPSPLRRQILGKSQNQNQNNQQQKNFNFYQQDSEKDMGQSGVRTRKRKKTGRPVYECQIGCYGYNSHDVLGTGKFSKVFNGYNVQSGENVAIKKIDNEKFGTDRMKQLLKTEIEVMKNLKSPHIVQLYEVLHEDDQTYLILEKCPDGDLDAYIQENGDMLDEQEAIGIIGEIIQGLKVLIFHGYIHRDIKPANTLAKNGVFKLADFGMAVKVDLRGRDLLRDQVGSPLYMSPQILQNQEYSSKSDIWSIGLLYYQMLFGKTPWPARDIKSLIHNINYIPLKFPYDQPVGQQTRDFIRGCLKISEDERYSWDQVFSHPLFQNIQTQNEYTQYKFDDKGKNILRDIQQSAELKGNIKKTFAEFNDHDFGKMNKEQFYNLLTLFDENTTFLESNHIFNILKNVDYKTNKNLVDLKEFKQIFSEYDFIDLEDPASHILMDIKQIIKYNNYDLKSIFDLYIKDRKDDRMELDEFSKVINSFLPGLTQREIEICFDAFDEDLDGVITFEEFEYHLMYGIDHYEQDKANANLQKGLKLADEIKQTIKKKNISLKNLFRNADQKKKGYLKYKDFGPFIQNINKELYSQDIYTLFMFFDKDKDGQVTLQDLESIISKFSNLEVKRKSVYRKLI